MCGAAYGFSARLVLRSVVRLLAERAARAPDEIFHRRDPIPIMETRHARVRVGNEAEGIRRVRISGNMIVRSPIATGSHLDHIRYVSDLDLGLSLARIFAEHLGGSLKLECRQTERLRFWNFRQRLRRLHDLP